MRTRAVASRFLVGLLAILAGCGDAATSRMAAPSSPTATVSQVPLDVADVSPVVVNGRGLGVERQTDPPVTSSAPDPGPDLVTTSTTLPIRPDATPVNDPVESVVTAPPTAPPSVPTRNRLIGVHIDEVPYQSTAPLAPIEAAIGRIDVVHWYQAWGGGNRDFRTEWLSVVADSGRVGMITWEPWALTGEATQPEFSPAAILAGDHDDYIRSWAEGFAARGDGPWYLRPMHEMNGNWYPWSGGVAGGDPTIYVAAWRHVHELFDEAGATNVRWMWCPLVDDISRTFEEYYPGGDMVDVLCLDGYNWGASDPAYGGWREPAQVFDVAYQRIAALGPQPIWFGEVGSAPDGGDKAAWTADLLSSGRYPRVDAIVFFDLDKERDWRVHVDPAVAAAVRANR